MEAARYVQSTKNKKLVIFLWYIKKRVSQLLFCSIVMQNIQIFYGDPVMFILLVSLSNQTVEIFSLSTAMQ